MRLKTIMTLLGFLLFIIGMLALILSIVGVQLAFLVWMDRISPLFGFLAKIFMIVTGIVLIVIFRGNFSDKPTKTWPEDSEAGAEEKML